MAWPSLSRATRPPLRPSPAPRAIGTTVLFHNPVPARIGAGPDGGEVPILGGTRLTGRVGRQTIGVLGVVTVDAAGQPVTSFAVARIKRDVGRRGYVGAIAADRRARTAASTGAGIDGSLWPTAHLNVQGSLARTEASSRPGLAGRAAAEYSGDPWYAYGEYLVVGRDAHTAMGFVTRTDMRRSSAKVQYTVRPHLGGVRQISLYAGASTSRASTASRRMATGFRASRSFSIRATVPASPSLSPPATA